MIIHYFINVTKLDVFVLLLMHIFHVTFRQNSIEQKIVGEHVELIETSGFRSFSDFRSFSVLFLVFFRFFALFPVFSGTYLYLARSVSVALSSSDVLLIL